MLLALLSKVANATQNATLSLRTVYRIKLHLPNLPQERNNIGLPRSMRFNARLGCGINRGLVAYRVGLSLGLAIEAVRVR